MKEYVARLSDKVTINVLASSIEEARALIKAAYMAQIELMFAEKDGIDELLQTARA